VHYVFPHAGFRIDLPPEWRAAFLPTEEFSFPRWDRSDGTHLEIYAYRGARKQNVRGYVRRRDAETKTNCDGKPVSRVLSRRWITVDGTPALVRREKNCMVNREFLEIFAIHGQQVAEISIDNAALKKLRTADMRLPEEILQTFRFTAENMQKRPSSETYGTER